MPVFFPGGIGRVVYMEEPGVQADFRLVSTDPEIGFNTHRSIVTQVSISQQANFQFLHTLGSAVYVYVFGDRIGTLTLSGVSFAGNCPGIAPVSGSPLVADHGLVGMQDWYEENRLSRRQEPVRVMLGGRTGFDGFVVGFTSAVVDPSTWLGQWGLTLMVLPEADDGGSDAGTEEEED